MNRVRIEVYGSRYVISTPEDESYVRGLAKSLDEQLRSLLENNSGLTLNDALVLCAINFEDAYKKSEASADHMRGQLTDYLEDAARARIELEESKREIERLTRQLELLEKGNTNKNSRTGGMEETMNTTGTLEILAPAGSYDSLVAAVRCGANAVYLGSKALTPGATPPTLTTRNWPGRFPTAMSGGSRSTRL